MPSPLWLLAAGHNTHLSRSTTPSMQAPKSTTELMSVTRSRKKRCLSPHPTRHPSEHGGSC